MPASHPTSILTKLVVLCHATYFYCLGACCTELPKVKLIDHQKRTTLTKVVPASAAAPRFSGGTSLGLEMEAKVNMKDFHDR